MQLVLDDEIRWRSVCNTEQSVGSLLADDLRELVGSSNQQRRPVVVDIIIHCKDGQNPAHLA